MRGPLNITNVRRWQNLKAKVPIPDFSSCAPKFSLIKLLSSPTNRQHLLALKWISRNIKDPFYTKHLLLPAHTPQHFPSLFCSSINNQSLDPCGLIFSQHKTPLTMVLCAADRGAWSFLDCSFCFRLMFFSEIGSRGKGKKTSSVSQQTNRQVCLLAYHRSMRRWFRCGTSKLVLVWQWSALHPKVPNGIVQIVKIKSIQCDNVTLNGAVFHGLLGYIR